MTPAKVAGESAEVLGADAIPDLIVSPSAGAIVTRALSGVNGVELASGFPFGPDFVGGVRIAAGDLSGDGVADLVVAMGPGGGLVSILDGNNAANQGSGYPFGTGFAGGVSVAVGDVNGDGRNDIVAAPATGGGSVFAVNGVDYSLLFAVAPFGGGYTGGMNVATGDIDGDGRADIIVGQSNGGLAAIVAAATQAVTASAMPFGNVNGVFVAAGDVNNDGRAEVIAAPGSGNGPVLIFDAFAQVLLAAPVPYPAGFTGGVRVAATDLTGDGRVEVITAPGAGIAPTLKVYDGATFANIANYAAYPDSFTSGTLIAAPAAAGIRFTSASTATFAQGVAGMFSVTTTGFPVAVVSVTGALPAGVSFIDNGNGTATLAGTPAVGTSGSYVVTIRAANGAAREAVQSFTLTVTGAPAFTSPAATVFVVGTPGAFEMIASGGPAPAIAFSGSLPAGLTFVDHGNGTATVAGTPGAGTGGNYPLILTATNGIGPPATQNFVLTVNQAPAITSLNATAFTVNLASSFTVTATGFPAPAVNVTGALPSGITVIANPNGTATIAGTATTLGTFPLSVQATNGVGALATQALSLTIANCTIVNLSPPAGSLPGGTFNTAYSQTFTATGGSGHSFVFSPGLPPGLTPSSGVLSGSPSTTGTFNFTVTAPASGTRCAGSSAYTLVVSPNAQNETYNSGVGNTQYSVGAGTPGTPAVVVSGTVLTNDSGPGGLTAGPGSIASTNGGQVAMAANGTFLYTPPTGFAGGSDTFTYTLTDGNGATDTAVVTVNMSSVVWYVNAAAGAGGTGRSQAPFNTMTAAATAAQIGQVIYVHSGSPAGATALKASQRLQGAGEGYSLNGLSIGAGAAPTLQGTVTLANDVVVRALNVNAGSTTSIAGSGLTGSEVLTSVAITGGNTGLSLTNLAGTFSISGSGISGVGAGGGVLMSGGTGTVSIASSINSASGRAVSVQNRTGGTVTFSGAITDTGTGILLNANTGSTIAFNGGLSLGTGANAAFTATGGGTVTATQNNTSIVNTIDTTSGTALIVADTQIAGSGLTFRRISSSGGIGAGIILDNTGTAVFNGGLTVTGNGVADSGGIVGGKAGADGSVTEGVGLYLNSTRNVSLNRMALYSFFNSAIVGRNVFGFLMADSVIYSQGTTAGIWEGPVVFGLPNPGGANGVQGTATFRNTTITGGVEHNVAMFGQSGTVSLTIERTTANPADCKVEDNSNTTGGHGVVVQLEGTASGSVSIQQCLLRGLRDAAVHATALGNSHLSVTVNGSGIGRSAQGERGIVLTNGDDAALTAAITNSDFFYLPGPSIHVGQVSGGASVLSILRATISNNIIATAAEITGNSIVAALSSSAGAQASTRLLLLDNFIEHYGLQPAILIHAPDVSASPVVDVTLSRNHVDMMETTPGVNGPLGLVVRNTQSATASMCANVAPNTFHWIPIGNGTGGGLSAEQGSGSPFRLERGSQTLGTPAATVLAANNGPHNGPPNGAMLPGSTTNVVGTLSVVENGTCVLPSAP